MSITLEQAFCDHYFDENFKCIKCHMTDFHKLMYSKLPPIEFKIPHTWNPLSVDYISDLHLDHWIKEYNPQHKNFKIKCQEIIDNLKPKSDVLIIAGDLGHYDAQIKGFLSSIRSYYKHIIVVLGNHDLYFLTGSIFYNHKGHFKNRIEYLKNICNELDIHLLDGDSVTIENRIFYGAKGFFDLSLTPDNVSKKDILNYFISDFSDSKYTYDHGHYRKLMGGWDNGYLKNYHSNFNIDFMIESELEKINNFQKADVYITHYSPVKLCTFYDNDWDNVFYYFNGDNIIKEKKPKVWVHGHIHRQINEKVHDTQIICNPYGSPSDNLYTELQTFKI